MIDLTKYRPLAVGEVRREGDVFRSGSPVPHHGSVKQGDEGYRAPVFRAVRLAPDGKHRLLDEGERVGLPEGDSVQDSEERMFTTPWPPPEASDAKPERCPIPNCIRAPGHVGYHASASPASGAALLAENSRLKKRLAIAEGLFPSLLRHDVAKHEVYLDESVLLGLDVGKEPDRTVSTCVTSSGVVMRNFDRDAPRVDAGRVGWTGPMTASDWPAEVVIDEQYGEEFDH